ncbi:hypothetical protein, partial [Curtobacterium sp. CT11-133]|uniref:hypothetical protein n=1 Tax=Curtobacterium sp. CT11-133 TaxID=3243014 RepID=UPI0039AEE717
LLFVCFGFCRGLFLVVGCFYAVFLLIIDDPRPVLVRLVGGERELVASSALVVCVDDSLGCEVDVERQPVVF